VIRLAGIADLPGRRCDREATLAPPDRDRSGWPQPVNRVIASVRVMEQRLSLITLGVGDFARARAFYEALGWQVTDGVDGRRRPGRVLSRRTA